MKSTPSLPLSVAVIGGGFGRFHIGGILSEPDRFALKAFCDQNPAVVEEIARQFSLPPSCAVRADYHAVLDDPAIDAVVVSLPHHLHETACVEAADRGKHILLDKPIARTVDEADRIIEAARRNSVTLMIGHQMRFYPLFRKMHDLIASRALGRPIYAETCHHQKFYYTTASNWRVKASTGGGCVIGSGIHNIDLMRWFFGEPAEVFALGVHDLARLDGEAAASISIRFQQGTLVNFTCNWVCHGAMDGYDWGEWAVFCEKGDIACHRSLTVGREYGKTVEVVDLEKYPCESIWTHFADCVVNRTEPLINGPDARRSLALVRDIYQSMETGRPVSCGGAR